MNLALTVFNLLPLPQLDGGKMLASVLPERLYAQWVYDPKVEKSYQGILRRIYEGPSNVLTVLADKLGITSQKAINRTANGVTSARRSAPRPPSTTSWRSTASGPPSSRRSPRSRAWRARSASSRPSTR